MSTIISKISVDDAVFSTPEYKNDRMVFNYIEGARQYDTTEFLSDHKNVIICRKAGHNSVWIWTNDEMHDNMDFIISVAKAVREFNSSDLKFFVKPAVAQMFSDMYALISYDLDYQVKSEFSLGVYKYCDTKVLSDNSVTVQRYNKKFKDAFFQFYMDLKDEFHWSEETVISKVNRFLALNTYLLLKNGNIVSVCVISDDDGECSSIRSTATKQEERNKGYGSLVTNIACKSNKKDGNSQIMLYTNIGNLSANATFKKAGFKLVGNVHLIKS